MNCQCSTSNHIHPGFAIFYYPSFECQPKSVPTTVNIGFSLVFKIVFNGIPGQFIGIFKCSCNKNITNIININILNKPVDGIVGLKWEETRKMFGKEATEVEKLIEDRLLTAFKKIRKNRSTKVV